MNQQRYTQGPYSTGNPSMGGYALPNNPQGGLSQQPQGPSTAQALGRYGGSNMPMVNQMGSMNTSMLRSSGGIPQVVPSQQPQQPAPGIGRGVPVGNMKVMMPPSNTSMPNVSTGPIPSSMNRGTMPTNAQSRTMSMNGTSLTSMNNGMNTMNASMTPNLRMSSSNVPMPNNYPPELLNMIQQNKSQGNYFVTETLTPIQANGIGNASSHQAALSNILDRTLQASMPNDGSVDSEYMQDFPFVGSQSRPGSSMKPEQEFNLGADDFPALPGYKAPSRTSSFSSPPPSVSTPPPSYRDYPTNMQSSDTDDRSSHYQPNMNFAKTIPMNSSQMSSYPVPDSGMRPTANALSTYEQFLQRQQQQQQQQHQQQPTQQPQQTVQQPQQLPQQQSKTQQQQQKYVPDRFGLLGLLSVIRMTDADLNTLALGTDLTTLGLNLNSPDCLYSTFASPWAEGPSRREPEFYIPMCYYVQNQLQSPMMKMGLFSDETLFYIFYSMPKDVLQVAAAIELYKREWRYHKEHKLWFTRISGIEPTQKTAGYERGSYIYFDVASWEKLRKDNFLLAYDQLETASPVLSISSTSS